MKIQEVSEQTSSMRGMRITVFLLRVRAAMGLLQGALTGKRTSLICICRFAR